MFKITIEETKTVKKTVGKEYRIIGEKEVLREPNLYRDSAAEPKTRIENIYGYTPETENSVEVTSVILTQEVETLDLALVIKSINKL